MEFKAKLPEHNNNVSPKSPLKELATLMFGLSLLLFILYGIAGLLVDWAVDNISPQAEVELFRSVGLNKVRLGDVKPLEDDPRQRSLKALSDELLKCVDIGYPVELSLSESKTPNAMAFPGGSIVVYSAIYDKVQSENGLAFILAHELAHFANRDHLRGMGRATVLFAASSLLGMSSPYMNAVLTPVESFNSAQYSQENESNADALALDILNCHYGHVGGATEFFDTLIKSAEGLDFELMHYFASHPEMTQRIEQIKQLSKNKGYSSAMVTEF